MPSIPVVFYKDDDGSVPVLEWLQELQKSNRRAFAKCAARIRRLAELGHELRRPEADYLRDGIYELRAKLGHVNYRILYFFHGQRAAVLTHALTKRDRVPDTEIERAVRRKQEFLKRPAAHTHEGDDDGQDQRRDETD